jgi:hypothetical protein
MEIAQLNRQVLHADGSVLVEIEDAESGKVIDAYSVPNLVVATGFNIIRDLLAGDVIDALTHFALGTDTTAPLIGNQALGTEVYRDSITQFVDESATLKVKYYLPASQANGNTIGEAGIFNSAAGASMFNHVLISPTIVKTSSIAVTFTWTISISGP